MPIPTLLVTIRGPLETTDLELPGDLPISELIPLLLEICGSQKNASQATIQAPMSLQVAGTRAPLPADKTLFDVGVYDGAVLLLQAEHAPSHRAERLPLQQGMPNSVQPDVSTGGIGVTWETL